MPVVARKRWKIHPMAEMPMTIVAAKIFFDLMKPNK